MRSAICSNLDIDVAKYLPSDDSSGFDNMAGTLSVSSTLVEAYVDAAQKISRLAMGEPVTPSLYVYRAPEDSSQDYHVEGLPFGTRGGVLLNYIFPSEGEYSVTITPIFGDNMSPTGFGSVECEKVEVLLDGERIQLSIGKVAVAAVAAAIAAEAARVEVVAAVAAVRPERQLPRAVARARESRWCRYGYGSDRC